MNSTAFCFAAQSSSTSFSISWRVWMSSAENGSSIRMMSGSRTSVCASADALAHAARELVRIAVAEAARPTRSQPVLRLRARLGVAARRGTRGPAVTLSSAVRHGISASVWNM